jgi:Tol biopolymer transport system component
VPLLAAAAFLAACQDQHAPTGAESNPSLSLGGGIDTTPICPFCGSEPPTDDTTGTPSPPAGGPTPTPAPPAGLLFARKDAAGVWQLYNALPNGSSLIQLTFGSASHTDPARSPDYTKIAYAEQPAGSSQSRIVVMNADGTNAKPVTPYLSQVTHPSFSPDGKTLAFAALAWNGWAGPFPQIFTVPADGSAWYKRVTNDSNNDVRPSWINANEIAYVGGTAVDRQAWAITASGASPHPITSSGGTGDVSDVTFAKDGSRMAIVFNKARMIQVLTYSPLSSQVVYTAAQGEAISQLSFSYDGSELAFIDTFPGGNDLARISSSGGTVTKITTDPNLEANPAWAR